MLVVGCGGGERLGGVACEVVEGEAGSGHPLPSEGCVPWSPAWLRGRSVNLIGATIRPK